MKDIHYTLSKYFIHSFDHPLDQEIFNNTTIEIRVQCYAVLLQFDPSSWVYQIKSLLKETLTRIEK